MLALVAHDNMKRDLAEWVDWNSRKLSRHHLVCTGTTGKMVEKTLRDHYQIRAVLEGYACVLCVETGADLSALQNCLKVSEEMIASGDSSRYSDMNQSFHYEIWNASGNEKLVTMLSELWNGLSMGVQMTEMEYAKKSFAEHKEIYEAIAAKDAETARARMEKHIRRSLDDMLTRYRE